MRGVPLHAPQHHVRRPSFDSKGPPPARRSVRSRKGCRSGTTSGSGNSQRPRTSSSAPMISVGRPRTTDPLRRSMRETYDALRATGEHTSRRRRPSDPRIRRRGAARAGLSRDPGEHRGGGAGPMQPPRADVLVTFGALVLTRLRSRASNCSFCLRSFAIAGLSSPPRSRTSKGPLDERPLVFTSFGCRS